MAIDLPARLGFTKFLWSYDKVNSLSFMMGLRLNFIKQETDISLVSL